MGIDDPILRQAGARQFGKNRIATGDRDELFDPADSRNQRVVPLFEKRSQPRPLRRGLTDPAESGFEVVRELLCLGLTADQAAEHPDHLENFGDRSLVERDHGNAAPDQFGGEVRLEIGEGEHEVGPKRLDLVEAGIDERRNLWFLPCFRRPDGVARHADDSIALAEEVQGFGRLFSQADDAFGVVAHCRDWGWDWRLGTGGYHLACPARSP